MTATGALIARHVTDLFPTQTSRFDLAQAARRGVIAPLRCLRIPPGPGVQTIAKVPLRKGDVDVEFDQELLAELLDQLPFNLAIADLYKTRFNGVPGVVYAAGVRHAYNVAEAFREEGIKAEAVSGETKKRDLAEILARYERGDIDVLVNAQLLAEGWNSPRATVCMHLAPTASKRIYQQRVGRVTRRHPGQGGGRRRRLRPSRRPATTTPSSPCIRCWTATSTAAARSSSARFAADAAGACGSSAGSSRCAPRKSAVTRSSSGSSGGSPSSISTGASSTCGRPWPVRASPRAAGAALARCCTSTRPASSSGAFLITAVERNRTSQLRIRALQEIAAARDAEAFDRGHDVIGGWPRDERREGAKVLLQALTEKRIGRRDQANAWIWRMAEYTRELHEEYAVQRWPETKRLLGLLVNSAGGAHARNARRLVQVAKTKDRRLSAALLAAAVAHTPEAESVLRDARTRMARKPSALSRELLRNFPKAKRGRRRRKKKDAGGGQDATANAKQVATAARGRDPVVRDRPGRGDRRDRHGRRGARAGPVSRRPEEARRRGRERETDPQEREDGNGRRREQRRPERVTNEVEAPDDSDRPTRIADGTVVQRPVALRTVTITSAEDEKPAKKRSGRRSGAARKRAGAARGKQPGPSPRTALLPTAAALSRRRLAPSDLPRRRKRLRTRPRRATPTPRHCGPSARQPPRRPLRPARRTPRARPPKRPATAERRSAAGRSRMS